MTQAIFKDERESSDKRPAFSFGSLEHNSLFQVHPNMKFGTIYLKISSTVSFIVTGDEKGKILTLEYEACVYPRSDLSLTITLEGNR